MATLTQLDLTNASKYATHMHRLNYISRWRSKLPHILIDYEIRPANDDDYYVPPSLADKAVAVKLSFSKRGCESMSCYPFNETGPIDYATPFGYTQTSDTAVAYAQPACYHLNRLAATRDGAENEIQAPELKYVEGENKCILMDTLSKMYFNSPYLRTDEHLIQGVDDVPAFNIVPNPDPLFPEMFVGSFNEAYCRRFGRQLNSNGGCTLQWWESLIGFVLGDTILITFKLLTNNIFSELRQFDYTRPSPILPEKPTVDSTKILNDWFGVRDFTVDTDFESIFATFNSLSELGIDSKSKLIYTAEKGFETVSLNYERVLNFRSATLSRQERQLDDDDLESIISQFLEDNSLIMGLATSEGFDLLFEQLKALLKRINTKMIPAMKKLLLQTSRRVTTRMLGETYKAVIVHQFNRIAIKTITTVAKAMTKIAMKAASVVGIVLLLLTLTDLVLALWDPFGYSNMFPREFPADLSRSFLGAYFQSMGESRDMVEFLPDFFDDIIEDDDTASFESLLYILDYVASLEVNSNGQMLHFEQSERIDDFDEATLLSTALASSSMYSYLEFRQYTHRHNNLLYRSNDESNVVKYILPILFTVCAVITYALRNKLENSTNVAVLFLLFILMIVYCIVKESVQYYWSLGQQSKTAEQLNLWYRNLYKLD
ncbi:P74 [Perigonia lusca single nucleopolyhedrovirus]|uniref:p74 n=1 Tax=Perigonia lusca single nucleopolyhedrovirus TaxID=1675865 RepID=A0A0M3N053_9ABAC|nr:P74 [Perigonia lusca single nucleopolyhedrovirus]AKN80619.1 P74 [Perigonia lusca single nucleopolyhedrovirus]